MNIRNALHAISLLVAHAAALDVNAGMINGGFESPSDIAQGLFDRRDASTVPGWEISGSDNSIELFSSGFTGVSSYEGNQFVEVQSWGFETLFQDVAGIGRDNLIGFQFAHRGRIGFDTLRVSLIDLGINNLLGGGDDTVLFSNLYTTNNNAWKLYSVPTSIIAMGNTVRLSLEAVSSASGAGAGNFVDAVNLDVQHVPELDAGAGTGAFALVSLGLALVETRRRRV